MSKNGMITSIWGPNLWHFLHTISFNYPLNPTNEDKQNMVKFINNIQHVLPCRYCRENFPKNLKAVPLTKYALKNRKTFSRWMYRFHSHINDVLGKSTNISFEDVEKKYESFRAKCTFNNSRSKNEKGCT